jgi:hypothetical protein
LVHRLAGRRMQDVAFDDHVVGAADHEEMLDMIAADDDELPLTIEIEGVHDRQPRLTPAAR